MASSTVPRLPSLLGWAALAFGLVATLWTYAQLRGGTAFIGRPYAAVFAGSCGVYLLLAGGSRVLGRWALPAFVLAGGMVYIGHLTKLSPIDEAAHFAVIAHVAKHGKIPRLDAPAAGSIVALAEGRYPGPPSQPPGEMGMFGRTYQSVHPPLYFVLGAAVHALSPSDLLVRLRNLRLFGVLLLAAAALLLVRSAELLEPRLAVQSGWMIFAATAPLVLCPGVLLRCATLGNLCLTIFLASLLLWLHARELARPGRWSETSVGLQRGAVAAALALTHVFAWPLVAAECLTLALARRWRAAAWTALLFTLGVALWVALNFSLYGAPTGSAVSLELQRPTMNPTWAPIGLEDLLHNCLHFFESFWKAQEQNPIPHVFVGGSFLTAWYLLAIVVVALRWTRRCRLQHGRDELRLLALLAIPATPALVLAVCLQTRIMIILGRYLFALLPMLLVCQLEATRLLHPLWRTACGHGALLATAALWWSYLLQLMLTP
ncbi:MAG: hypothetical protein JSR82_07325 [Verrucomicrobia bacterium]|nr:hypothetical protein [Verrucomicrobiota bacterium]